MTDNDKALTAQEGKYTLVEAFKGHAMAAEQIMAVALKSTHSEDWVNYGGKAWLDGPGSERIARALGLTVKDWKYNRIDMKDDEGPHYYIITEGKVGHAPSDLWTNAVGSSWTRKPFWYKNKEKNISVLAGPDTPLMRT